MISWYELDLNHNAQSHVNWKYDSPIWCIKLQKGAIFISWIGSPATLKVPMRGSLLVRHHQDDSFYHWSVGYSGGTMMMSEPINRLIGKIKYAENFNYPSNNISLYHQAIQVWVLNIKFHQTRSNSVFFPQVDAYTSKKKKIVCSVSTFDFRGHVTHVRGKWKSEARETASLAFSFTCPNPTPLRWGEKPITIS